MITRARSALTGLAALTLLVLLVAGLPGGAVPVRRLAGPEPTAERSHDRRSARAAGQREHPARCHQGVLVAGLAAVRRLRARRGAGGDPRAPVSPAAPWRPAGRCGATGRAGRARLLRAVRHHAGGIGHGSQWTVCGESRRGRRRARRSAVSRLTGRVSRAAAAEPGSAPALAARSDAADVLDFGSAPATATRLITVRTGDCLWSIAQRYLGAGDRYPEIVSLDYGHDMGDGQVFTNPSLIEPGWRLFLPGDDPGSAVSPAQSAGSQHLGHATKDSHYRRRHPSARTGASSAAASREAGQGGAAPGTGAQASGARGRRQPGQRGGRKRRRRSGSGRGRARRIRRGCRATRRRQAGAAQAADRLAEAAIFVSGALAGAGPDEPGPASQAAATGPAPWAQDRAAC